MQACDGIVRADDGVERIGKGLIPEPVVHSQDFQFGEWWAHVGAQRVIMPECRYDAYTGSATGLQPQMFAAHSEVFDPEEAVKEAESL
jgi:hypothetical protein